MDIITNIFCIAFLIGIAIVSLLMAWQEINLNKELHDKEKEKIETEILLIKEQISNNNKIALKKVEQIERTFLK